MSSAPPKAAASASNGQAVTTAAAAPASTNGRTTTGKKKQQDTPIDPVTMYESVRSRIAALEEEEGIEEEEDSRMAEQARSSVKGMSDSAVQARYIELYQQIRRIEREHAREKQRLTKEKDTAKSSLTKANQAKTKLEALARQLQKDNKQLREDSKRLLTSVEDAQDVIENMKGEIERKASATLPNGATTADTNQAICIKIMCRYRAELYFKITRHTKFERLFKAWASRMDTTTTASTNGAPPPTKKGTSATVTPPNPPPTSVPPKTPPPAFIYTYNGRPLGDDLTLDDVGMEDGDTIIAVEMVDLTEAVASFDLLVLLMHVIFLTELFDNPQEEEYVPPPQAKKLKKKWSNDPTEARKTLDEIFDTVVRGRLEDLLTQYELRERHFEAVIRSKQLELLLAKARVEEQKQIINSQVREAELQSAQLSEQIETMREMQSRVMDKLVACCNDVRLSLFSPNGESLQRLLAALREEMERRGITLPPASLVSEAPTAWAGTTSNPGTPSMSVVPTVISMQSSLSISVP
ncbi:hypothetical protein DL93DRAFT_2058080 [Clavulina sp. PMI_390]|nr:hypothetical protein DL93DRAFT_2058080 [Clavulina sp. PMI_390]